MEDVTFLVLRATMRAQRLPYESTCRNILSKMACQLKEASSGSKAVGPTVTVYVAFTQAVTTQTPGEVTTQKHRHQHGSGHSTELLTQERY